MQCCAAFQIQYKYLKYVFKIHHCILYFVFKIHLKDCILYLYLKYISIVFCILQAVIKIQKYNGLSDKRFEQLLLLK